MVNLNLVNKLILTAFISIFAGIGTIADRVAAADPLPSQELIFLPEIPPPISQLTDTRIGLPMLSTDGISVFPASDLQLPDWALSALQKLDDRYDCIEAKTEILKQQQFSATTKLSAQVWVNFTGAFTSNSITAERSLAQGGTNAFIPPTRVNGVPTRVQLRDTNPTVSNYLFLTLNSSFTGKDMLVTQLVAGNANSPANQLVSSGFFNTWGVPITDQTGTPQAGSNAVYIRELSYSFPINDSVKVAVGPRLNTYRYFDQNRFTNFTTGAGSFNSSGSTLFAAIDRGSGAIVSWNISPQFRFNAGYLGENTEFLSSANGFNTSSNPAAGLFGSTNQAIGELTYSPNKDLNLKLLYSRSLIRPYNGFIGGDGGKQQELEISYYYPASDNLAIVPAFYAIFNPNNFQSNSPVYVGNLRMQFSF